MGGLVRGSGGWKEGSPTTYRQGFLVRRLPSVDLYTLNAGGGSTIRQTTRLKVTGLQPNLIYLMGVAAISNDPGQNFEPKIIGGGTLNGKYPVDPGTIQITPFVEPPQSQRLIFRPVFQDPTATDNKNHPLGQDIPFAWVVNGDDADGAYVDVDIPLGGATNWGSGDSAIVTGTIVFQLSIAYDGSWWDTNALEKAIGQVRYNPTSTQTVQISTLGGG